MNEPLAPVVGSTAPATLPEPAALAVPAPALPKVACQNCGVTLEGEYCAACGQRHEPHVKSLGHFASEAFESITHADSRLWRTLGYLLARPGFLSREFFSGRRARYLPPFRLYLVISVLFFVVAGMAGHMNVDAADEDPPTAESVAALQKTADSLEAEHPEIPGMARAADALRKKAAQQQAVLEGKPAPPETANAAPVLRPEVRSELCNSEASQLPANATWGERALFGLCQKVSKMRGEDLLNAVTHNIPRAMFVFLPLLALVMKLLYWRPKRYYVEHLLFLVHNHAFVFLAMGILAIALALPVVGQHLGLLTPVIWLYTFWYLFRAMRVYYGQSRALTIGKFMAIGFAYISAGAIVLAGTALYSAMTL